MTAAVDTRPVPEPGAITVTATAMPVRVHLLGGLAFLLLGVVLLIASAATIAWPDLLSNSSGSEYLTYGRTMPMALNALVFGWLTIGLLAVAYHIVPRMVGSPLAFPMVAAVNGLLMFVLVGVGVGSIGAGQGEGGRLLEMPWYADAGLVITFLVAAVIVSSTVRRSGVEGVPVPVWYLIAAPWWLFLSYTAGAIPGLGGAPAELQSAFSVTAVMGLWVVAAAVGGGYYLVAKQVEDVEFHPRLGRIGFWSLGLLWVWTAARTLQYGPMGDWMETIPVLFSSALIVAVLTIAADFALALRGKWEAVTRSMPLQLFALGTALFVLVPGHMLVQSLRSSSTVVRFTAWETAFDLLTILGVFTLWTAGLISHVAAAQSGRSWTIGYGRLVSVPLAAGVLFAVGTRWVAGLQQGYTWLAAAQSGAHENTGDGFFNTVAPLHGTDVLTVVGLSAVGFGVLALVAGGVWRSGGSGDEDVVEVDWPDHESPASVRRGAAFVFAFAAVAVFAFPAIDSNAEPSLLADSSRDLSDNAPAASGRALYIAEGCWYCHTQQVRAIVTDVGLGPVSAIGDYAHDPAGIFGVTRIGPDLAHAGSRAPTEDAAWVRSHLADPRVERPWSTMPAYGHLTDSELTALAAYITGLE